MQFADLDLNKVYSYADYFKWQFDERVELIKGKIFKMSPAPNPVHQTISGYIHVELGYFLKRKQCRVYSAPFDVRLPQKTNNDEDIYTVLQPDLSVICDKSKIDKKGCIGAPDIVVEILSTSNNTKDIIYKFEAYEQAGVKEYWVVSQDQTFVINTLVNGKYVPSRQMTIGDTVTSPILPGFSLDLKDLFESTIPEEAQSRD